MRSGHWGNLAVVAALTQSPDAIEAAIERHIASDGELNRRAKALRGVRGGPGRRRDELVADLPGSAA